MVATHLEKSGNLTLVSESTLRSAWRHGKTGVKAKIGKYGFRDESENYKLGQGHTSYLVGPRLHAFHGLLLPSLPSSSLHFPSLSLTLEVDPLNTARSLWERCKQKSNLVHFSLKICHLVAPVLQSFLRII